MRLVITQNITLDVVVAQLYGRNTFEAMRGFWPKQVDDTTGVTDECRLLTYPIVVG